MLFSCCLRNDLSPDSLGTLKCEPTPNYDGIFIDLNIEMFVWLLIVQYSCMIILSNLFCSGWIYSLSVIGTNLAVAVFMMVVAGFFTVSAVLSVILLKMVLFFILLVFSCPENQN